MDKFSIIKNALVNYCMIFTHGYSLVYYVHSWTLVVSDIFHITNKLWEAFLFFMISPFKCPFLPISLNESKSIYIFLGGT